jgi:hypothetical protein
MRFLTLWRISELNRGCGTVHTEPEFFTFREPKNRFQWINSACPCSLGGRYDNPLPSRFLVPVDCLKIPAQCTGCMYITGCTFVLFNTKIYNFLRPVS